MTDAARIVIPVTAYIDTVQTASGSIRDTYLKAQQILAVKGLDRS